MDKTKVGQKLDELEKEVVGQIDGNYVSLRRSDFFWMLNELRLARESLGEAAIPLELFSALFKDTYYSEKFADSTKLSVEEAIGHVRLALFSEERS